MQTFHIPENKHRYLTLYHLQPDGLVRRVVMTQHEGPLECRLLLTRNDIAEVRAKLAKQYPNGALRDLSDFDFAVASVTMTDINWHPINRGSAVDHTMPVTRAVLTPSAADHAGRVLLMIARHECTSRIIFGHDTSTLSARNVQRLEDAGNALVALGNDTDEIVTNERAQ